MSIRTECPRKQSDMTPCFLTDGENALTDNHLCVGCEHSVEWILTKGEMTVTADAAETGKILLEGLAKAEKAPHTEKPKP